MGPAVEVVAAVGDRVAGDAVAAGIGVGGLVGASGPHTADAGADDGDVPFEAGGSGMDNGYDQENEKEEVVVHEGRLNKVGWDTLSRSEGAQVQRIGHGV